MESTIERQKTSETDESEIREELAADTPDANVRPRMSRDEYDTERVRLDAELDKAVIGDARHQWERSLYYGSIAWQRVQLDAGFMDNWSKVQYDDFCKATSARLVVHLGAKRVQVDQWIRAYLLRGCLTQALGETLASHLTFVDLRCTLVAMTFSASKLEYALAENGKHLPFFDTIARERSSGKTVTHAAFAERWKDWLDAVSNRAKEVDPIREEARKSNANRKRVHDAIANAVAPKDGGLVEPIGLLRECRDVVAHSLKTHHGENVELPAHVFGFDPSKITDLQVNDFVQGIPVGRPDPKVAIKILAKLINACADVLLSGKFGDQGLKAFDLSLRILAAKRERIANELREAAEISSEIDNPTVPMKASA